MEFRVEPEDPHLVEYLSFVKDLVGRDFRPLAVVRVETINSEPASRSPYKPAFLDFGFREDFKRLTYHGTV